MIDWTHDKIAELISLVQFASILVAVASVAYAYAKTRSLVTLLVAALTAGLFLWTVHNTDWWQQRVDEESGLGRVDPIEDVLRTVVGRPSSVGRAKGDPRA